MWNDDASYTRRLIHKMLKCLIIFGPGTTGNEYPGTLYEFLYFRVGSRMSCYLQNPVKTGIAGYGDRASHVHRL